MTRLVLNIIRLYNRIFKFNLKSLALIALPCVVTTFTVTNGVSLLHIKQFVFSQSYFKITPGLLCHLIITLFGPFGSFWPITWDHYWHQWVQLVKYNHIPFNPMEISKILVSAYFSCQTPVFLVPSPPANDWKNLDRSPSEYLVMNPVWAALCLCSRHIYIYLHIFVG